MKKQCFYFWFESVYSGEEFFVYAETQEKAKEIANQYFGTVKCYGKVTPFESEIMGYDVY